MFSLIENTIENRLLYGAENGLKFSLSIYTTDLDGLDLTAVAQQVYLPM